MKAELTYKLIAKLKPSDKEYEVRDIKVPGLVLRVPPSGKMVYTLVYARGKRVTIGPADAIDHEQARAVAKQKLGDHYKGEDPIEKQKRERTKAGSYLQFLDDTYKPWLELNLVHGLYAYTTLVKAFPELHSLALNEITPGMVETWRTRRLQEGLDPNTINRQLSDLKACLHRARDIWDIAISDKLDRVKPCKIDRSPKVRYLTAAEESRLLKALDDREEDMRAGRLVYAERMDFAGRTFTDHLKPAILLSLHTGLRRGELLKLKWEDVHLDRANLTVVGSTSKTGKTRHVPLNQKALSILKAWKEQPGIKSQYVFTGKIDARGAHPMTDIGKSWENILQRAKIAQFRWHDLRHTFASKLVMAGVDLNAVRELLGHADYKMTLRYAHLAPEHKAAAVAKLVAVENAG